MAKGLFKENMTLEELDSILEKELSDNRQEIRIIADLPVTEKDYDILMRELAPIKSNMELLVQYRISVVTAWVFALHYGKEQGAFVVEEWTKLPQYSLRQFMELCSSVFIDYDVAMYFTEIRHEREFFNMLVAHAGIPERMAGNFCALLEELVRTKDMERALQRMSVHTEGLLKHVTNSAAYSFLQDLLGDAANLMNDCKLNKYTEEELRERYPLMSSRLIRLCLEWEQKQKKIYPSLMQQYAI